MGYPSAHHVSRRAVLLPRPPAAGDSRLLVLVHRPQALRDRLARAPSRRRDAAVDAVADRAGEPHPRGVVRVPPGAGEDLLRAGAGDHRLDAAACALPHALRHQQGAALLLLRPALAAGCLPHRLLLRDPQPAHAHGAHALHGVHGVGARRSDPGSPALHPSRDRAAADAAHHLWRGGPDTPRADRARPARAAILGGLSGDARGLPRGAGAYFPGDEHRVVEGLHPVVRAPSPALTPGSREHSVQVPGGWIAVLPIDPERLAAGVRRHVIVAPHLFAVPPSGLYALGPRAECE